MAHCCRPLWVCGAGGKEPHVSSDAGTPCKRLASASQSSPPLFLPKGGLESMKYERLHGLLAGASWRLVKSP